MRRRSERSKGATASPEKTSRKPTRRSKRSNSRASDIEKQPSDDDNEVSGRESSSERENSRIRRKLSRGTIKGTADEHSKDDKITNVRPRRGNRKGASSMSVELDSVMEEKEFVENGDSDYEILKIDETDNTSENLNVNNPSGGDAENIVETNKKLTDETKASVESKIEREDEQKENDEKQNKNKENDEKQNKEPENDEKQNKEPENDEKQNKEKENDEQQNKEEKNDEKQNKKEENDENKSKQTKNVDGKENDEQQEANTSVKISDDASMSDNKITSDTDKTTEKQNIEDDSKKSIHKESESSSDSNSDNKQSSNRSNCSTEKHSENKSPTPPSNIDETKEQSPEKEILVEAKCIHKNLSVSGKKSLDKDMQNEATVTDQSIDTNEHLNEDETMNEANESDTNNEQRLMLKKKPEQELSTEVSNQDKCQVEVEQITVEKLKVFQQEIEKPKRKRKWLTQKSTEAKQQILAISTDSLRNIIADVKPVPLSDVKLESSPEPELVSIDNIDNDKPQKSREKEKSTRRRDRDEKYSESSGPLMPQASQQAHTTSTASTSSLLPPSKSIDNPLNVNRKISIVNDGPIKVQRPPSPPKNSASNILYITNLVRPFTVLQLKGLLARTGKICENGFWIDKIKSKCYVKYETEDEAVETRHALHGIRWPASNPKCLNVDFGTVTAMGKAIASTSDDVQKDGPNVREERVSGGWDRYEMDERREPLANRPIREWDLGKKDDLQRDRDRDRDHHERDKDQQLGGSSGPSTKEKLERGGGGAGAGRDQKEKEQRDHRSHRGKDVERRRRSSDRIRRSPSLSPSAKYQRKENDPPIRLLDDLFRKTKATPCIYWLPLTAEQIAVREEARRKHLAEHKRRMEETATQKTDKERERGGGGGSGGTDNNKEQREKNDRNDPAKERDRINHKERRERSTDRRKDLSTSRASKSRDTDRDRRRY